ncbi:hypothetical protein OS493_027091 [Desmophyllum pertusum]|uniref:Uncharacterized protein n=1 Tax=Desmophyllum pertusum TaxID=174260 RepID=A0A9X0CD51_9CNID|nr:hypothetical protein OS493_027091 [Desmophyllum pertusum]
MSSKDSKGSSDSKKDKTKKESKREGDQDDSSSKAKKTFGMFWFGGGRKAKSDKRGSKYGSSDSLKNSAEFERRGSEFSLEDSTASAEVSTTSTEASTTTTEVSTTSSEVSAKNAEVEESSEIAKPQSGSKASNETLVVEKSSEVKIINAVYPDLAEDKDIKKPGTEQVGEDHSSPKEEIVSEKLAKEALKEESVSFQEQTPVASKPQTFEFKLQSSVILSEANKNEEEKEQRAEESKKERVQLKIEENVSTHEKAPESGRRYEVSLEEQEEQEAQVNVEAVVLSYLEKEEDQVQNENQDGLVADEEEPVVLESAENQFQELVDDFLKLDANNEEISMQKGETAKIEEIVIAKRSEEFGSEPSPFLKLDANNEERSMQKGETVKVEEIVIAKHSEQFARAPSPFDEKSTFITSTPNRESTDSQQGKRKDELYKTSPAVSYDITRFKGTAVAVEFRVQIVNNIKDVKMCTKALLAQLAQINKKLRTLQKELVEIQKNDSDQEPEIVNTEDA